MSRKIPGPVTPLSRGEIAALEFLGSQAACGQGAFSNRLLPRAGFRALVARGIATEELLVVMDGDFRKEPERHRIGYQLTDYGRDALAALVRELEARR